MYDGGKHTVQEIADTFGVSRPRCTGTWPTAEPPLLGRRSSAGRLCRGAADHGGQAALIRHGADGAHWRGWLKPPACPRLNCRAAPRWEARRVADSLLTPVQLRRYGRHTGDPDTG